jgi:hypothetical protein
MGLSLLAGCLLLAAGCEKDEIRTYTVSHPPPEAYEEKVRLLAAILENGDEQWFFKLVGPVEEVGKHSKEFTDFITSLRFTDKEDNPVEWKAPAGWDKGPADEDKARNPPRFATFYLGPRGKAPVLTVFKFGQRSPLLANVERWCRQDLGRKAPRSERELKPFVTPLKNLKATPNATLVDMTGPGPSGRGGPHPGGIRMPGPLAITWKTPSGWKETGPRLKRGIIKLFNSFEIRDGDKQADVEVSEMIVGGGLLLNVNRWRDQVGLPEITQVQLGKDPPQTIQVAGTAANYHDFTGPAGRMLIVTVPRKEKTWFFKLIGPADLVGANKKKFESFVQSVKFTGAADE